MRDTLIKEITELAAADPGIEVLTGDLGFGVWREFAALYPERFTNVGIMEQSMLSLAAGMALTGRTVFVYSIGCFPVLRCLEQIRNDCAYHGANVKIAAAGAGLSYGVLGMSHFATEDIGAVRALPDVRIYCPADQEETRAAVRESAAVSGTCYLRLGRTGADAAAGAGYTAESLRRGILRKGAAKGRARAALLVTGDILTEVLPAAQLLEERGISCCVYSIPLLKPFDPGLLVELAEEGIRLFATVEEHQIIGGLGSMVAEASADRGLPVKLLRLGLKDRYPRITGSRDYLRSRLGLTSASIACEVERAVLEQKIVPGAGI